MVADFADAHARHWEDAEILYGQRRLANADHLYGLSAECGLKAIMVTFGLKQDAHGSPHERSYRKHIDALWARYTAFIQSRSAIEFVLPTTNPFDDWRIDSRYSHRSAIPESAVTAHREGALLVKGRLSAARLKGLIK